MALCHNWDVKNDFSYVLRFFSLISVGLGGVTKYITMKFLLSLGNVWSLNGGLKMDPSLPKSKIPTFILQYHGAPLHYTDLLSECNLVFTILFTIECAMKLSSFGYQVNTRFATGQEISHFWILFGVFEGKKNISEISWLLKKISKSIFGTIKFWQH